MPTAVALILCALILFSALLAFWMMSRRHTRVTVGFDLKWPAAAGAVESRSAWGTAQVNGYQLGAVAVSGECVRLLKCHNGYVVQLRWMFGGGYIFLPEAELRVARYAPHGWLRRECRGLFTMHWQVIVYGALAEFVA
jgi:hypothetical protein